MASEKLTAREATKALLKEAETWAGNDHGDRAMRLLPGLLRDAEAAISNPVADQLKRGLDNLRARASRGGITSAEVFSLTDPLMDILHRAALSSPTPKGRE